MQKNKSNIFEDYIQTIISEVYGKWTDKIQTFYLTKIKSKPINLSWQQNSLVERMSRKEGFPKDQGYHGKLSQPATH